MRLTYLFIITCNVVGSLCTKLSCDGCRSAEENTRIKRAKYYSSPPQRFYKRPPMSYSSHGAFSYTPPPGYMTDEEDKYPSSHGPAKYNKRPSNTGLGEKDFNNLIKYLSKKDLDKIVEYAAEKDKYRDFHSEKYSDSKPPYNSDNFQENENENRFSLNGPYIKPDDGSKIRNTEYTKPDVNFFPESKPIRVLESDPQDSPGKVYFNNPLDTEESMQNQQFAIVDAYIKQELNGMGNKKGTNIFTDSKVMDEESLPAPVNLRHEDYDASFTNNVPAVVKAETNSYKIENFGNLPLMNYNSKLHSVNSYSVPHYTVTTPNIYQPPPVPSPALSQSPPTADGSPLLELAPSIENYRDQSDAHLKAIKIWSHKSRGTAYTLHGDGTLSLERPMRPKPKYG